MCFRPRGTGFRLSQSPLWLNSSELRPTCPGLLLRKAPKELISHFQTGCCSCTFNDLPTVIFFFLLSVCFLLTQNEFLISLILDILCELDWVGWMPDGERPSKMQINLEWNWFAYLLCDHIQFVSVYRKYALVAGFHTYNGFSYAGGNWFSLRFLLICIRSHNMRQVFIGNDITCWRFD